MEFGCNQSGNINTMICVQIFLKLQEGASCKLNCDIFGYILVVPISLAVKHAGGKERVEIEIRVLHWTFLYMT